MAVLFDWNLNRLPFLGQVVNLDMQPNLKCLVFALAYQTHQL